MAVSVTRSAARREAQWRRRNPELAAKFDRLPAAARANIRTAWSPGVSARGVSNIVRSADIERRASRRSSDQRRRRLDAAYRNLREQLRGYEFSPKRVKQRIAGMTDAELIAAATMNVQAIREAAAAPGERNPWRYH
jgi:hypothetical protein